MPENKHNLLYNDLTHEIIGVVYKVVNQLGYGYQEKYYQRGIAEELKNQKIRFQKELSIPIKYSNKIIGRYFMDFVIDNKVVLELKVTLDFYETHINQLLAYLKSGHYRVGLLMIITKNGVKIKRLVN